MAGLFSAWWSGSPVLQPQSSLGFTSWWQGAPVLQMGTGAIAVSASPVALPVELRRTVLSGHAALPVDFSETNVFPAYSPTIALPLEIRLRVNSARTRLLISPRGQVTSLHAPLRVSMRARVRSARVPLPVEIVGRDVFELLLDWNEYRSLDQTFFLVWNETSFGQDQTFSLEWVEKDLLGALDLTWREIPVGMTDLFGQVQRPYGRATKTPNP